MEFAPFVMDAFGDNYSEVAAMEIPSSENCFERECVRRNIRSCFLQRIVLVVLLTPALGGRAFCHCRSMEILQQCSILTEALIQNRSSCKYTSISADNGLKWSERGGFLHFCSNFCNSPSKHQNYCTFAGFFPFVPHPALSELHKGMRVCRWT